MRGRKKFFFYFLHSFSCKSRKWSKLSYRLSKQIGREINMCRALSCRACMAERGVLTEETNGHEWNLCQLVCVQLLKFANN